MGVLTWVLPGSFDGFGRRVKSRLTLFGREVDQGIHISDIILRPEGGRTRQNSNHTLLSCPLVLSTLHRVVYTPYSCSKRAPCDQLLHQEHRSRLLYTITYSHSTPKRYHLHVPYWVPSCAAWHWYRRCPREVRSPSRHYRTLEHTIISTALSHVR